MTAIQKVIKYLAIAFAILLIVSIISGIVGAFAAFSGFFSGNAVLDEAKLYDLSSDIKELDIRINAAELIIKQGEKFSLDSNLKYLEVIENGSRLTVKETRNFKGSYNGARLTLYVPANTVFSKADIRTGAGRFTVDTLVTDVLELELGAGQVEIGRLVANSKADIDGGAGEITIKDGSLTGLDFDMGVGRLKICSEFLGRCELDLGVGQSDITIIGSRDNYTFYFDKGIGSISLDGEKVSSEQGLGNGKNILDIDGGIGAIDIKFK